MNNTPMQSSSTIQLNDHKKSHKKLLIILGIVITVFIIIPIFLVAWLGFVPGLSDLLGAKKAKDLGIRYSQNDLTSYQQKTAIKFLDSSQAPADPQNPTQKSTFTNLVTTNTLNLTDEELTAGLNNSGWSWMPMKNIQARFSNGTIELSGNINLDNIEEFEQYIADKGGNSQDFENTMNWVRRIANDAPVYARANAEIKNNILTFTLRDAQIGRLNIPLGSAEDQLKSQSTSQINSQYFKVNSATLEPGILKFDGTYPSQIYL